MTASSAKNVTVTQSPECLVFCFPFTFVDFTGKTEELKENKNLLLFIGIVVDKLKLKYEASKEQDFVSIYFPLNSDRSDSNLEFCIDALLFYYSVIEGVEFSVSPINVDLIITPQYFYPGDTRGSAVTVKRQCSVNYKDVNRSFNRTIGIFEPRKLN